MDMMIKRIVTILLVFILAGNVFINISKCSETAKENFTISENAVGKFEEIEIECGIPDNLKFGSDYKMGYLTVPEDHENNSGKNFKLAVAIFPARNKNSEKEPIVFFAGGPGESTFESFIPDIENKNIKRIRDNYTIILVELRGLKYSIPNLLSDEIDNALERWYSENLQYNEKGMELYVNAANKFIERLQEKNIDYRSFTLDQMSHDVVMLMNTLGYKKFNIFGNSDGTMIVQRIMKLYEDRIITASMSSVYPVSVNAGSQLGVRLEKSLNKVFKISETEKVFSSLNDKFRKITDKLNENPLNLVFKTKEKDKVHLVMNGDRFTFLLYNILKENPDGLRIIPMLIEQTYNEDYDLLESEANIHVNEKNTYSWGVDFTIKLSENDVNDIEQIKNAKEYDSINKISSYSYIGTKMYEKLSKFWDVKPFNDVLHEDNIQTEIPTLTISGELDPISPPEYADIVSQNFLNKKSIVLPYTSHSPINANDEIKDTLYRFIINPENQDELEFIDSMKSNIILNPIIIMINSKPVFNYILLLLLVHIFMLLMIVCAVKIFERGKDKFYRLAMLAVVLFSLPNIIYVYSIVYNLIFNKNILYDIPGFINTISIISLISIVFSIGMLVISGYNFKKKFIEGYGIWIYPVIAILSVIFYIELLGWKMI